MEYKMKKKSLIAVLVLLIVALPLFAFGSKETKETTSKKTEPIVEKTTTTTTPEATAPVETAPVNVTELTSLSTPVYKVELTEAVYITQEDIDEAVAYLSEATGVEISEEDATEYIIDQQIFNQELVRTLDKGDIPLYDGQFNDYVSYRLVNLAAQYGISLASEEDANLFLSQLGMTLEDFAQTVLRDYAEQYYVTLHSNGRLESIEEATEDEIQSVYNENLSVFVSDEYVQLAHIYFAFGSDKNTAKVKADTAYNNLTKGLSWKDAVTTYSEDNSTTSTNGEFGFWLAADDIDAYFGEKARAAAFELKKGEYSDVIEGVVGYHIIKLIDHMDAKLLTLDDLYYPNESMTVRDFIADRILLSKQEMVYSEILDEVMTALKQEAKIERLK